MNEADKIPDVFTSTTMIGKLHDKLIKWVVGKKPVMMNMNLETEYSLGLNNFDMLMHNNTIQTTKRGTDEDISMRYSKLYAEDKNKTLLEVKKNLIRIIDDSLCLCSVE